MRTAPSLGWLIVFRVGQAVGAAMLQANSVAIITAAVPRRALGRAIGVQGAAQAVGLSIGPSVGGLLIDSLGWRWVFFIAVPFGLLGTILAWFVLPWSARRSVTDERFDWLGAVLLGPVVGLSLLGLTYGNSWGWTSPALLSTAGLAAACLSVLVYVERHTASPLIDLDLLRMRSFSRGLVAGLLSYAVLFGSLFLIPFYLERVLGQTAAQTGLCSRRSRSRWGSWRRSPVRSPIASVQARSRSPGWPSPRWHSLGWRWRRGLSLALTLGLLAILGIGLGLFTPPNNSAVMGSAPPIVLASRAAS